MPKYCFIPSSIFLLLTLPLHTSAQIKDTLSNGLSKGAYAKLLTQEVATFYETHHWSEAVKAAQQAIATDSLTYAENIDWHAVGVCRYMTKDYEGAVNDLSHFIILKGIEYYRMEDAVAYTALAYKALGKPLQAAKAYERWDELYNHRTSGPQNAAILYKATGDTKKFKQLMKTALLRAKCKADSAYVLSADIWPTMAYAELLIIAGKNQEAIDILKSRRLKYSKSELTITSYLNATARYIKGEASIDLLKKELAKLKPINMWDFSMFDRWLAYSGIPPKKQQEILSLQHIIDLK